MSMFFRVVTTEGSPTGRPCPFNLAESKPCPALPCYKWVRSQWSCDLQVKNRIEKLDHFANHFKKAISLVKWPCFQSCHFF